MWESYLMSTKQMKTHIFIIMAAIATLCSCSDDVIQPQPPDPCANYTPEPPKILVYEILGDTTYLLKDRFYGGYNSVLFAASKKCDKYEWTVGSDSRRWTDSAFSLFFDRYVGDVTVRLITFASRDTLCNPADNGRDTVYATYTVISPEPTISGAPPIHGVYRGVSTENLLDTFNVTINFIGSGVDPYGTVINNLPKGCFNPENPKVSGSNFNINYGQRSILVYKDESWYGGNCRNMYGNGWLDEDGKTFTFKYNAYAFKYDPKVPVDPKQRIKATFRGVRQ